MSFHNYAFLPLPSPRGGDRKNLGEVGRFAFINESLFFSFLRMGGAPKTYVFGGPLGG